MFLIEYVLPFLVLLTALIFVHELGHFLAARYFGVKVDVFSIGFGREIFGWNDKHGTRWRVSWLPLGGYVKMAGDANESSAPDHEKLANLSAAERAVSFHYKPVWQRAIIVAAGPIINFLFAFLIYAVLFTTVGQPYTPPVVGEVVAGTVAEKSGLKTGDRIISIDNIPVERFEEVQRLVRFSPEKPLLFLIQRQDQQLPITITPAAEILEGRFGQGSRVGRIGVMSSGKEIKQHGVIAGIIYAIRETAHITALTFEAVTQVITGERSAKELGGPLRIGQISGEAAQDGVLTFIGLVAVISINLGLINLFPIPALDGGHLVLYAIEAMRRKPVSERIQAIVNAAGIGFILMLTIFVFWSDLTQLKIIDTIVTWLS